MSPRHLRLGPAVIRPVQMAFATEICDLTAMISSNEVQCCERHLWRARMRRERAGMWMWKLIWMEKRFLEVTKRKMKGRREVEAARRKRRSDGVWLGCVEGGSGG